MTISDKIRKKRYDKAKQVKRWQTKAKETEFGHKQEM
jgi:hypothetical protein